MRIRFALSVQQPWANRIASGEKTIETRTWSTNYRGPLLIVSSRKPPIPPAGFALAVCDLIDCRPMLPADEPAACCEIYPGAVAWVLADVRPLARPYPLRGSLGLYTATLPDALLPESSDSGAAPTWIPTRPWPPPASSRPTARTAESETPPERGVCRYHRH